MRKLPSTVGEYIAVGQRRWKLFFIPALLVPVAVFAVSRKLPRTYKSTTSVLIQTQVVPKSFVDDTLQSDAKDRFQSISNLILSQGRLMHIVEVLGLDKLPGVSSREEAMVKLRKDLTIEMESDREEKSGSALFKISYIAPTAKLAQQGAREVADLSISGNLESRERQAQSNITFIEDQLERAQTDLHDKEARLNAFREQHSDILPAQTAANMQVFSQSQSLATSNGEALERAVQQRTYLESMLTTDQVTHSGTTASHGDPLDPTLAQKLEELRIARQRYTDKHPDVARLRSEIAVLQNRSQLPSSDPQAAPASPGQRQLQNQLAAVAAEIQVREKRQAAIEGKMHEANSRVSVSPVIAGEAAQLQSDYEAAQKYYTSIQDKQHASSMTADLEKSRGHDLVQILDPAYFPKSPNSPNLQLINVAGVGIGLLLGLLLALGVDLFDQTFHSQEDLAAYLTVPMIAIIPTYNPKEV